MKKLQTGSIVRLRLPLAGKRHLSCLNCDLLKKKIAFRFVRVRLLPEAMKLSCEAEQKGLNDIMQAA